MMARCHPNRRKPRSARKALLVVGEGPTEKAFLTHLKALYETRDSGFSIKIENAHGGSPECIVDRARKLEQMRAYDAILIVMDTDRPWPGARQRAKGFGRSEVFFVGTRPCVEGLLLSILGHAAFEPAQRSPDDCRRVLREYGLSDDTKTDVGAHARLFTRELLESSRGTVPALGDIVSFLTTGSIQAEAEGLK